MPHYRIIVDLSDRSLYLLDGNTVVRSFPVGIGKMVTKTPKGEYRIINKQAHPDGPFGALWMGFVNLITAYTEPTILPRSEGKSVTDVSECTMRMSCSSQSLFPSRPGLRFDLTVDYPVY